MESLDAARCRGKQLGDRLPNIPPLIVDSDRRIWHATHDSRGRVDCYCRGLIVRATGSRGCSSNHLGRSQRPSFALLKVTQQIEQGSPEGLLVTSAEPNRPDGGELIGDSILPLGLRGIYYITTVILCLAASGTVGFIGNARNLWRDATRLHLLIRAFAASNPVGDIS